MPNHVNWEPGFSVGHELIDAQHKGLLTQCKLLADHLLCAGGAQRDQEFDQAFDSLKALAREHFEAEASLLAGCGYPGLEDHGFECDEFDYLVDEIVTTEHFDRLELQRFLASWFVGHIAGSAQGYGRYLASGSTPASPASNTSGSP